MQTITALAANARLQKITLTSAFLLLIFLFASATPAHADPITVDINGPDGKPASSVVTLIGITLLSVAPALMLMVTPFLKIFVTLSITRFALGLQTVPPNQVIAALALFLSFFIMAPVLGDINTIAVQPYSDGQMTLSTAWTAAQEPLSKWMLAYTRESDIGLLLRAAGRENPETAADLPITTLIPAFMLSELRAAMIIGFVVFVPFLIIDLVVSSALMSMGMMMLPPTIISVAFKLIFFVLVDGWALITTSLVSSYTAGG